MGRGEGVLKDAKLRLRIGYKIKSLFLEEKIQFLTTISLKM